VIVVALNKLHHAVGHDPISDLTSEKLILKEAASGPQRAAPAKLLSPARRRACVDYVVAEYGVSERLACPVPGQHRSTQRKPAVVVVDEATLRAAIIALALQYGRYGYRRITALLRLGLAIA
jgi:putative transposase